jgi:protein-S-isoprenylcysteine O-methyltransferase Ste14
MKQVGPTIIRLVPSSPVLVGGFAWAGAILFVTSLGYFLFTYTFTFGRVTIREVAVADLLWNLTVFTVFALHHSVFARRPVREAIARTVPAGLERSVYVWIASLLFILVCRWWRPVPGVAWEWGGSVAWLFYAIQSAGIWLAIRSAAMIDVRDLAGLTRLSGTAAGDASAPSVFKTSGPYGWVRHPIYAGWFLIVFASPVMTMTRLEFAVVSGVYLLIAIPFEERTLEATAGEAYARYASRVRWRVLPGVH